MDTVRWSWLPGWWSSTTIWLGARGSSGPTAWSKPVVAPRWRYRVHRWEVTGDVVYTLKGWISRTWQLVPITRLQTVDHTQGWLERLFDLATVKSRPLHTRAPQPSRGCEAQAWQLSKN